MGFVVEKDSDRYGSPSWSGDDPVKVVCLLFGWRLNHWDPPCWIIPCSVRLKWCSRPLSTGNSLLVGSTFQQGSKRFPSQSLHDSHQNIAPRHLSLKQEIHREFPAGRVVWAPSKVAPNTIKSHTVKITSGCGILGWDEMKLNRGRKAKEKRRIFHSSKTIICYWCRNILILSMSQNTLAFHLPMLQQPFFSISVWPQAFYA